MSRREDIDNAIWSDPDFEALSPHAKLVYLWSFTNSRCGMGGIYKVALNHGALEVGLSTDDLSAALDELAAHNFAFYVDHVLWVRSRVRHLRTRTPQIARAIAKDVERLSETHPLRVRFLTEYGAVQWLLDELAVLAPAGGWAEPSHVSDRRRQEVLDRDEHKCLACGATSRLHIDHIRPVTRGGTNDIENLQTLCVACNARKGLSETDYRPSARRGSVGRSRSPLGEIHRSSTDRLKTVKGNGNGKGTGKGPLGRGVGREPNARDRWRAFVDEHFPGHLPEIVHLAKAEIERSGREATIEAIRAELENPDISEAA